MIDLPASTYAEACLATDTPSFPTNHARNLCRCTEPICTGTPMIPIISIASRSTPGHHWADPCGPQQQQQHGGSHRPSRRRPAVQTSVSSGCCCGGPACASAVTTAGPCARRHRIPEAPPPSCSGQMRWRASRLMARQRRLLTSRRMVSPTGWDEGRLRLLVE